MYVKSCTIPIWRDMQYLDRIFDKRGTNCYIMEKLRCPNFVLNEV